MSKHPIFTGLSPRSRRVQRSGVLFAAMFALAACGSSGGDGSPTAPPSTGGGGGAQATLTVTNQTVNYTASFVRTRSCGGSAWSDDLLGGADYLEKGETVTAKLAPGCYDVRVTPKESDVTFLYFYAVQLTAGQTKALSFTAFPTKP